MNNSAFGNLASGLVENPCLFELTTLPTSTVIYEEISVDKLHGTCISSDEDDDGDEYSTKLNKQNHLNSKNT